MNERQSYSELRHKKSKSCSMEQGVYKDELVSLELFNLYHFGLPSPPDGTEIIAHAVDCTIMPSGDLCHRLNSYVSELAPFFQKWNMKISAKQLTAAILTTQTTAEMKIHLIG